MMGRLKKTGSVACKEKLLAEIAHYEKRIVEALNRRRQNSFVDESFEEHITNPYKLQLQPRRYELKKQEARLSDCASMTLELAMLTIMQSEVNVMVTPPEVRRPVLEDGVWHEVAAECKIDLVSFTITFYAHRPYRRFAPIRYRNLAVALVKPAHQTELAQSILPKLQLPNLALQVLQSYATAFRSRRTTLLELAERYADKLKMQAMPEGGYRVRFLDLLLVDWTLENLWSPIVPFCHRMRFEVEYMPKDYISAIGKLYKQFKDPSLETSERTAVLARIFDICLQAATPAREMQESFESDPETAGRLHERRTTIDQEPDVPHVEHSPKKPSGKENKAQNRKTDMAPPKTIPKKAKKSKPNQDNTSESRKSVKRAIESDNSNAKRSRNDDNDVNDVNSNSKAGLKGGSAVQDRGDPAVGLKAQKRDGKQPVDIEKEVGLASNEQKKSSNKITAKTVQEPVKPVIDENNATRKTDGKTLKSKTASNTEVVSTKNTNVDNDVGSSKDNNEASSKGSKKNSDKKIKSIDFNTEKSNVKSIKGTHNPENTQNGKTVSKKTGNENNVIEKDIVIIKKVAETKAVTKNGKSKPTGKSNLFTLLMSKDNNKKDNTASSKNTEKTNTKSIPNTGITNTKDKEENATKKKRVEGTETVSIVSSKPGPSKDDGKDKAASKTIKVTNVVNTVSNKIAKNDEKDTNKDVVGKTRSDKTTDVVKVSKNNTAKKNADTNNQTNKNSNTDVTKANKEKNTKETAKDSEKNKVVKEKQSENPKMTAKVNKDTGKEKVQKAVKRKVDPMTTQQKYNNVKVTVDKTFAKDVRNDEQKDTNDEVLTKKTKTTEAVTKIIRNNEDKLKKSVNDTEKPKNNPKSTVNSTRILKENTNRNETVKKAVENNKIIKNTNKTNQKNMLNVTITKPKIIPLSKLPAEKQINIADKLKTKIPMMKNKISSLSNKLGVNVGKISGVEKSKIPQKSLPVFKKVAKNLPTRISPRKTFKPQGYSNK